MQRRSFLGMLTLATLSCSSSLTLSREQSLEKKTNPLTRDRISLSANYPPEQLWPLLQQGDRKGLFLVFRHALAPGVGDPPNFKLDDCLTQRNLSQEGRQQAVHLGEAIRSRNISISRVLSSQWCRCLETAKLMNVGKVEPFPLLNSFFERRNLADAQTEQMLQFFWDNRQSSRAIILISHQVNILALSQVSLRSAEGVVLKVQDDPPLLQVLGQLAA